MFASKSQYSSNWHFLYNKLETKLYCIIIYQYDLYSPHFAQVNQDHLQELKTQKTTIYNS